MCQENVFEEIKSGLSESGLVMYGNQEDELFVLSPHVIKGTLTPRWRADTPPSSPLERARLHES